MKIGVIGVGYVGLVTAACLAQCGHHVIGADQSAEKIATLQSGGLPIWEKGLDEVLGEALKKQRIRFTVSPLEAIREADALFIAVGTPSLADGSCDLSQVWNICDAIAEHGRDGQLIILKSTIPVGTTDEFHRRLKEKSKVSFLDVVHNPEFLRQGQAVHDFLYPDRIVVGHENPETIAVMNEIYQWITAPIQFCDRKSAELIKYASNAFLAMKISYINMFAELCEKVGAHVEEVAQGMGADRRIGPAFLRAGIGYGGSCFPKDTKALLAFEKEHGTRLPLVQATEELNRHQLERFFLRLKRRLGILSGKKIAVWGLSFKPETDDIREAPSLRFCERCLTEGAEVHAYDPLVQSFPIPGVNVHQDLYAPLRDADALALLTEWDLFRKPDWSRIQVEMNQPLLFDGRNLYAWEEMKKRVDEWGLEYHSIGRPTLHPVLSAKRL